MREIETEVLIVGAGPAGSVTSHYLSKKKISHILIDKAVFPRDKICGDALSGKVVQEIKRIDPSIIQEIENKTDQFIGSYGVRFIAPAGHHVDIPFKSDLSSLKYAPGYIAKRFDFDNFLLKKIQTSYCTLLENTELKKITASTDGYKLQLTNFGDPIQITARVVISAEGERSIVARELGLHKMESKHFCAGIRAYFSGVKEMHNLNFIELHFLPELLPGYLWIFPLPNGRANVGIGMLSSVVKQKKISLRHKLLGLLKTHPSLKDRFLDANMEEEPKGWGLPLGSRKRKLSGDNFLLTGDAASLIDPFTGEGIGNAMISGRLAAERVSEAIEQERFDSEFLSAYDSKLQAEVWGELKLSHTLQKLSSKEWLFNWVVKKAASNKELRELITGMFEDIDTRAKLSKPGFYFKLLFNKG